MAKPFFTGELRQGSGTRRSKALRKAGKIPAVIYGFNKTYRLSLAYKDYLKEYLKGGSLSKLVSIQLVNEKLKVIPREVQIDPVTDKPIHIDFQLIKDNISIKVAVLIKAINKDRSPGIKRGGILNIVKKHIDLRCTPENIPNFLQIDVANFEIGKNIHINDIKLPDGVVPVSKDNVTVLTIAGRDENKVDDEQVQKEKDSHDNQEGKEEK